MILIITHKQDYTADFVVNKLNKSNIKYKRLNCEDLININYCFNFNHGFSFSFDEIGDFKSVWFRRTKFPEIKNLKLEERNYILSEYDSLLKNIFATLDAKWLSKPEYVYKAENKALQLKIAQKVGLNIPPTIITNNKQTIVDFSGQNDNNIVIKPLAHTRINYIDDVGFIFTNKVPEDLINSIEEYDINPCIIQKNIPKDVEIRVTVINKKVFAASVDSQSNEKTMIDWRKEQLEFSPIEIPKRISNMCLRLLDELNISFGAIDFIKTPQNEFVFLEINPNGQWAWIEMQTGQEMSREIINFLEND